MLLALWNVLGLVLFSGAIYLSIKVAFEKERDLYE